jgi:hypothetical protein
VHAAQAAVILALSTSFALPVTGAFMEAQPGSGPPIQDLLFDVRIGPLVGAFLLLAALDHGLVALPRISDRYERSLAAGVNPFRWVEYSLSASLMRRTPRRRRWLLRCCRGSWRSLAPADRATHERATEIVRDGLERRSFDTAFAAGRNLTFEDGVAKALLGLDRWDSGDDTATTPTPPRSSPA